jgi:multidrug efflux system membrane fusion protein
MNIPLSAPNARKRNLWLLVSAAALLAAGAIWLHFHRLHQADASPPAERTPWALRTAAVERGSVAGSIQAVAVIEAPQDIVLSPQIQGTVLANGPRAGVAVRRGELLVRIDGRATASNLSALEQQRVAALADADYAAKQQARTDAVLAEGGVSQAQADQARTAADGARARARSLADQIAALRVQLGYAEIRAPRDAVVAERMVEVGDTVGPGKPVYRLTAGTGAVVRVSLPSNELARIKVGDMLELQQGTAGMALPIARVAPAVSAAGLGSVEADAAASPFGLPSGSTVAAAVRPAGGGEALTVPEAALVGSGDKAHVVVFVAAPRTGDPGRLKLVPVQVLQVGSARAAVRGALTPGEPVVVAQTAVLAQLRDGDAAVTGAGAGASK